MLRAIHSLAALACRQLVRYEVEELVEEELARRSMNVKLSPEKRIFAKSNPIRRYGLLFLDTDCDAHTMTKAICQLGRFGAVQIILTLVSHLRGRIDVWRFLAISMFPAFRL